MKKQLLLSCVCWFLVSMVHTSAWADCTNILDDFQSNRSITYYSSDGSLNQSYANPASNYVNGSATCARYFRSGTQYDNIFCSFNLNGDYFRSGVRVFKMDVYSPAAGLDIDITLTNNSISPYPTGRHSIYRATTTKVNAWETLIFAYITTPDNQAYGTSLDQLLIAFAPNTTIPRTFYFDNITVTDVNVLLNYEGNLTETGTVVGFEGSGLSNISNQFPYNEVNSSYYCARYDRSTAPYDLIVINPASMGNGNDFKTGVRKFILNLYSKQAGTVVAITIANALQAGSAYPAGRHSVYQTTTTKTNEWEKLTFDYLMAPDPTVAGTSCDQIFLQIDAGSTTATYWDFDDLIMAPVLVASAPSAITGATTVCQGQSGVTYSVTGIAGSTFTWNLPPGASIGSGNNTSTVSVNYAVSASSGSVAVRSNNAAGCSSPWSAVDVTVNNIATANAGADKTVCTNVSSVSLSGTIGGSATTGTWATTGSGDFLPNNTSLNASYTPTPADISAGSVSITFMASGGSCGGQTDDLLITFISALVNAGDDDTYCTNISAFGLGGSVGGSASTGTWTTSGTGVFTPNANTVGASYQPSASDKSNGPITLTLTSTNGSCPAAFDSKVINFVTAPTVNAGNDQTVCNPVTTVQLGGITTGNPATPIWSTAGNGIFSDDEDLNATYTPSSDDKLAGSVIITLSANGGMCGTIFDNMLLSFSSGATVDVGANRNVCNDVADVALVATVSGASSGSWTTNGGGTFAPNNTSASVNYNPTATDRTGSVTFTYTTSGGSCGDGSDATVISFVICSSTLEAASTAAVSIYPNPAAHGEFTIDGADIDEVTVVNAWGQTQRYRGTQVRTDMKGVLTVIIKTTSDAVYTSKVVMY